MKKTCGTCGELKNPTEFWKRLDKLQPNCILCQKVLQRERYQNNRKAHIKRVRSNNKKRVQAFQDWKSTLSCTLCGENYNPCLDFHHLDSNEKDYSVANLATHYGSDTFLAEIAKCIVVCKNCHVKIHNGAIHV